MRTRGIPQLSSFRAYAFPTAASVSPPSIPHACTKDDEDSFTPASDTPKGFPTSSDGTIDVAPPAASIVVSPVGSPACPSVTHAGLLGPRMRRNNVSADAPCRSHLSPRKASGSLVRTRTPSTRNPSRSPFLEPRTPSIDRSRSLLPSLALGSNLRGPPLVPWLFLALAQLPTCVHEQVLLARSLHLPAIHRGSGATRRLPTSATE